MNNNTVIINKVAYRITPVLQNLKDRHINYIGECLTVTFKLFC